MKQGLRLASLGLILVGHLFLASAWQPFGVVPNLFLIALLFYTQLRPASEALPAAIAGGLLLDMESGSDFGLRTAFYALFVLTVAVAARSGVDYDNAGVSIGTLAAATAAFNGLLLLNIAAAGSQVASAAALRLVLVEVGLNIGLWVVMRPLAQRFWPEEASPLISDFRRRA